MDIITIDFESFWSTEYSLSKMSPLEYVLGDQFETISCSIKVNHYPTDVFFGHDKVSRAFASIQDRISRGLLVAHNMSGFDAYVCAYVYGLRPRMWGCTQAMARPVFAKTVGLSLAKLVEHFRLGRKNNAVLMQTKGKHLADFTEAELEDMKTYNREDTDQCYALFQQLKPYMSAKEMWQVDALTRMRVEPKFQVDTNLLETALSVERDQKRKHVLSLARTMRTTPGLECSDAVRTADTVETLEEAVRADLASAPKFSALLVALGAEVPTKISPTNPDKEIPALAKSDEAFIALQEHDNPLVAAAARARLAVKSTLLETRINKFLTAAKMTGGTLPVPLRYAGADTTGRDSGEEYNCLTAGHEVLTPNGWVAIETWTVDQPILQWWPDGRLDWCRTAGKVEYEHEGEVVEMRGPLARCVATPDHRVPRLTPAGALTERTAGWIADHSRIDGIPIGGTFVGGASALTPDQVRLLVATSADGCEAKKSLRWGFRKQRKIRRLQALLTACGLDEKVRTYDYRTKPGGHWVAVLHYGRAPDWLRKGFGPWILDLSRESLDALIDELPFWDGMQHSTSGNTCFFSSDADQAKWVSTAMHLSGRGGCVGVRSKGRFDVYERSSVRTSATGTRVLFSGTVYCPQVDSSFFLVRYDGAIHVTGNCQNLPRIGGAPRTSDALRNSMRAPKGCAVVVADLSGIELRVNHFLWQVASSMQLFQEDAEGDLYKDFAAKRYGVGVSEVDKTQRQMGKVAHLGLGFGAGAPTFRVFAKTQYGLVIPEDEAVTVVDEWREAYAAIVQGWKSCNKAIARIQSGTEEAVDPWGLVHTCKEGLRLPSGRLIRYPDLRVETDGTWPDGRPRRSAFYAHGRHKARLTGPKMDENIVQALARDKICDDALEFYRASKLYPQLRVHDELVYVVPESEAQSVLDEVQKIMRTPPKWWPELITWSEGDIAPTYGAAK